MSAESESGLGKSTLINSLFLTDLYSKDYPGPSQRIKKTVQVSPVLSWISLIQHLDELVVQKFCRCQLFTSHRPHPAKVAVIINFDELQ
ncbi:hypothetical protein XENOCAPTIV_004158 [Xenoophorus captivus]|uniref:Septin-type G domain-containing protein n=1 Tax=Xenoophorus captivus TaxID=1517983 RepID=A0ABV0R2Z9_9TELE